MSLDIYKNVTFTKLNSTDVDELIKFNSSKLNVSNKGRVCESIISLIALKSILETPIQPFNVSDGRSFTPPVVLAVVSCDDGLNWCVYLCPNTHVVYVPQIEDNVITYHSKNSDLHPGFPVELVGTTMTDFIKSTVNAMQGDVPTSTLNLNVKAYVKLNFDV